MKKKILLTTIGPKGSRNPGIQLALYYLKTYFIKYSPKAKEADIEILSFSPQDKVETVINRIRETKPDIISFSCYVWNILNTIKVARAIKKGSPHTRVVMGGSEVSPRAYRLMKTHNFIDAIVIGEGERTFTELIGRWLDGKEDISGIDGLACRKGSKIILTREREQITNLDEIPSPYLEKVVEGKTIKDYAPYVPTETMRGCPYRCHYCYYHKDFKKLNFFSLERVEEELKYLLEREPRGLYLMDPTFNMNKKRAKEVLRIIIKYNKKSNLHVELKAELLDEEMVALLRKARTDFIEIGIQSTNEETLKLINRHFEPKSFRKNILLLNKNKVPYEIQLIDGLPADNYETLKKAVDWLLTLRPRTIKIMRFMLLPGTHLRVNARRFGIKYNPKAPYHSIKSDTFPKSDLKKTEKLRAAMGSLYGSGLLRNSIYPLSKKLGLSFTDIFDEWNDWAKKEGLDLRQDEDGEKDDRIKKAISRFRMSKRTDAAVNFVNYLCRKYKKPNAPKELSESIRRDGEVFLEKHGVHKEKLAR